MPRKTKQPITAHVQRFFATNHPGRFKPDLQEKDEVTDLEIRTFVTEPAKVTLDMGVTLNLGNYETAKINVGLSVPCYLEEADEAYKFCETWVNEKVEAERKEVIDLLRTRAGEYYY